MYRWPQHRFRHDLQQLRSTERLLQNLGAEHSHDREEIEWDSCRAAAHGDHPGVAMAAAEFANQFDAVAVGHEDVGENEIDGFGVVDLGRVASVGRFQNSIALGFEHGSDYVTDAIVIVHDQDCGHGTGPQLTRGETVKS